MQWLFYHFRGVKSILRVLFLLFFLIAQFGNLSTLAIAQDNRDSSEYAFKIDSNYTIQYTPDTDFVTITEKLSIRANTREYYYPAREKRTFVLPDFIPNPPEGEREFKRSTVQVLDENNQPLPFTISENEHALEVSITNLRDVTVWNPESYTITYSTHELIDQNGNITNLYIPGLPKDTKFESVSEEFGIKTRFSFSTNLVLPKSSPEASYIMPNDAITVTTDGENRVYTVDAEGRIGETSWIQLGTRQYYYFKLHQKTPKTDKLIPQEVNKYTNLLSTNVFELPLPKEDPKTNQTVYFSKISPEPHHIRRDDEGNLIATFEVPANVEDEIIIEGYISMEVSEEIDQIPDSSLPNYFDLVSDDPQLQAFTKPDTYWESNNELIQNLSRDLLSESNTVMDMVRNTYNYTIDTFDYSYEKVEGDNPRMGALASLQGAQTVCMEYSDSMIALLRASGIPARAAVGYGNDPTGAENKIGSDEALQQNIGHQWVQVWIPDYGWLTVDPTWGESGRTYIGNTLDHILWYTIGTSEKGFIGTTLSSADPITRHVLTSYDVYLQALDQESFDQVDGLRSLADVVNDYSDQGDEIDRISTFIKTNSLGKVILILLPIGVLLFITTSLFAALFRVLKRVRKS